VVEREISDSRPRQRLLGGISIVRIGYQVATVCFFKGFKVAQDLKPDAAAARTYRLITGGYSRSIREWPALTTLDEPLYLYKTATEKVLQSHIIIYQMASEL
jgi:hypothetical protein